VLITIPFENAFKELIIIIRLKPSIFLSILDRWLKPNGNDKHNYDNFIAVGFIRRIKQCLKGGLLAQFLVIFLNAFPFSTTISFNVYIEIKKNAQQTGVSCKKA